MALLLSWQAQPDDVRARQAVQAFCARGAAHLAAWEEAKRVYLLTGKAIGAPATQRRTLASRRHVVTGVAAVASAAALWQLPRLWVPSADAATGTAEIRNLMLPDGSRLTLGPDSAATIDYAPGIRRIVLRDGMALCEAGVDQARPFVAEAGGLSARFAEAAAFELRREGDWSFAALASGRCELTSPGGEAGSLALSPQEWVSVGPELGALRRGRREAGDVASWRNRLLVAEQEKVGTVAASIARWRSGKVVVPQSGLANAAVSGLFDLSDPDAALAAVVAPHGGKVRHVSPWLTILTTI